MTQSRGQIARSAAAVRQSRNLAAAMRGVE
jgi:hypothetical protein